MESSSRQSCRTNSRRSSDSSCGCAFVQSSNKWRETFAGTKLIAELMRAIFSGDPAHAHAVQHAVGRIIQLNQNSRVSRAAAVAGPLSIGSFGDRAHLRGEEDGAWMHARRDN